MSDVESNPSTNRRWQLTAARCFDVVFCGPRWLCRLGLACLLGVFCHSLTVALASAETPEEDPEYIPDIVFARMIENPVSGITRLPVANATVFGIPPNQRVANAVVLAPIFPILFGGGWSIITRTTIPAIVTVPVGRDSTGAPIVDKPARTTGFGEISMEVLGHKVLRGRKDQFYDISWGPFVGFPSASDDFLGTGRWRLGPEVVLGLSAREWVTILVARNVWSVGENEGRAKVNRLVLDYFLFYNLPKLFYLLYETTVTADWEARRGDRWTLPIGIGFGRHHRLPNRPRLAITTRISGLYNAVRTDRDGTWQLIGTLVFWKPNPAVFDID